MADDAKFPTDHPTGYSLHDWPLYVVGQQFGVSSSGKPLFALLSIEESVPEAERACTSRQHFWATARVGVPVSDENFWQRATFPRQ